MCVCVCVRQMCEKVSVYGVGDGMAGSWHYFESRDFATSREFGEDPHHSFELEHDMLQIMHSANFIQHHRTDHANATFALKAATAAQVGQGWACGVEVHETRGLCVCVRE
jgi:hypothetical protein